ncbi:opsin-5 family protein [Sphingomonadaceae bacterium OTU29MARTA1]|uniref:hemerythrin domain-containing protein n=1 Tax=Sphingomonas sp. Leaf37 TaxID=2876552 RepID=UPI001E2AB3C3|nr:hemerythrin domain-containing protein [Sphingomonas sp. Leaf37]USU06401.1 opsin-5 family protein [Sphingomonadaceae bacterium OTU29LAMAA1]USU09835.1 opsin-5 family protein [Sphingomonadaceae bacterium OTU29MARTA1]USU13300.1 opsin-5 family protein [Sphingomonadaceae bacterium OTU29THOMA1]
MVDRPESDGIDPRRTSWGRLVGDHDRIARQCGALVALTRRDDRPAEDVTVALLELTVSVADHLGVEDQVIDMTTVAIRGGTSPDHAAAMADELEALKSDWTAFIVRWNPTAVVAQWDAFAEDAAAMLPRLVAQVKRENELLYTAALRHGVIDAGHATRH